jgi:hypothetical protein
VEPALPLVEPASPVVEPALLLVAVPTSWSALASAIAPLLVSFDLPPQSKKATSATKSAMHRMKRTYGKTPATSIL